MVIDKEKAMHLFIKYGEHIQEFCHTTAVNKGWWEPVDGKERSFGDVMSNFHAELSECWEGYRKGNPDSDKIGEEGFSQIEEELADLFIRVMDYCGRKNLKLHRAIICKMLYNEGRSHRHGGKIA